VDPELPVFNWKAVLIDYCYNKLRSEKKLCCRNGDKNDNCNPQGCSDHQETPATAKTCRDDLACIGRVLAAAAQDIYAGQKKSATHNDCAAGGDAEEQ
jgi:hypothetical protein